MLWYFGYPINGFSQIGQWNEERQRVQCKFEKWENPSEATLKAMGESIFLVQCAPCHGVDVRELWKSSKFNKKNVKEQVVHVIKNDYK